MGITQFKDGNINAATAYFDKAILKDDKLVGAYYYRGQCYMLMGQNEAACKDFNQAVTLGGIEIEVDAYWACE